MTSAAELWGSFPSDPRDPSNAPLRASDADRDVVQRLLSDAFADGRLDRDEYDERSSSALAARTLGQLPPLVADLVPERPLVPSSGRHAPLALASADELDRRAEEHWRDERRNAALGVLGTGLVLWVIWALAGGGWPWPLIVNAFALANLIRTIGNKKEIVASERRRLEKRQLKAIDARNKKPGSASS